MNKHLQHILEILQQENLTADQKKAALKSLKDADKELEITAFKLDKTEKVKHTTAVLLEETIAELEQKRKAVETQNRELEIEAALEKVRSRSLAMHKGDELQEVINTVFDRLQELEIEAATASIVIYRKETNDMEQWIQNDERTISSYMIAPFYEQSKLGKDLKDSVTGGKDLLSRRYSKEEKNEWFSCVFEHSDFRRTSDVRKKYVLDAEAYCISIAAIKNGAIALGRYSDQVFTDNENEILKRFARVFEQAYTRFLDLQKAEAQAREAQIQLAMERVRARTMAMQRSDELAEAASLLFKQIADLGTKQWASGFDIWQADDVSATAWMSGPDGSVARPFIVPYTEDTFFKQIYEARQSGNDFFVMESSGKELEETYRYMFTLPDAKKYFDAITSSGFQIPTYQITHCVFFSQGFLMFITYEPVPEMWDIFKRFAKVFEQTYTRFKDLEKAEAQAREAQIETALERVRSRSMGMQKSEELKEVIQVIYEQFIQLGFKIDGAGFALDYMESDDFNFWVATSSSAFPNKVHTPYFDHPQFNRYKEAKEKGLDFYTSSLTFEEKNEFFDHVLKGLPSFPQELKKVFYGAPGYMTSHVVLKNVMLYILNLTGIQFTDAENGSLMRFGKVFEQTYTRFNDLQKAEAQAREAQIEVALEKVRSRSLAMHSSQELQDLAKVVFEKLAELEFAVAGAAFIVTPTAETKTMEIWVGDNESYPTCFRLPYFDTPVTRDFFEPVESGNDFISRIFPFEVKNEYFRYAFEHTEFKTLPEQNKQWIYAQPCLTQAIAFSKNSLIGIHHHEAKNLTENEIDILKRFSKVFEQGYVRFLDLQKAEAQAREAQIEAALERVRANAMAMQRSSDLLDIVVTMRQEFTKLGHQAHYFWYMNWLPDKYEKAMTSGDGTRIGMVLELPRGFHGNSAMNEWELNNEPIGIFTFETEAAIDYLNRMASFGQFRQVDPNAPGADAVRAIGGLTFVMARTRQGEIGYSLPGVVPMPPPEDTKTLVRFAGVFDLAYQRYSDIEKAESSARAALQQSSLDRVRAEIASMRTKQDLERITPLIWKELTTLGIPFVRCGVFIMDEKEELIHTYLSTPDGKAIAAFHLPYKSSPFFNAIEDWRAKKIHLTHWGQEEFSTLADSLVKEGQIATREQYLITVPKEGLYLHYVPFMQGILYAGNTTSLTDDNLQLVQSVADAFSTAYARYEDFNKLEVAKQQVDKTLVDLKQTQAQLVQAEKMASLGELTAGIAHEIQNPLNFVNNFSEVSTELIDEMKTELATGNLQLVTEISNDLKQNLEKINHHGKRAADIVKGMLQHSRSSSGVKEPTNINALADEYLRLAYHGLRAKDKTFNAKFETAFDEGIGKVNVIPQDIGRVILNLITNAFYVVNEKSKQNIAGYEPTVTVSTHRSLSGPVPQGGREGRGEVLIKVKDNGNGIPQKILDKIFQPFFTTKPTGQGTGLGLSLSYDIVKAHGGELKVETKEGEGSEFLVVLSV